MGYSPWGRRESGMTERLTPTLTEVLKIQNRGASLSIQWLRLHVPNAGAPGLIPGPGTRFHMLQLKKEILNVATKKKILHATLKIPRAANKAKAAK